ncbi:uncharacterized protein LOC120644017 [Panicum virgatum]|uniref:uncharacterized protein LOC120644017 n=1 Tax=Panicum virgatum TaxID=38727 RepID=UPI0019D6367D|nr:uncharacterized protein LOC120644017 [Panicum virgatum]
MVSLTAEVAKYRASQQSLEAAAREARERADSEVRQAKETLDLQGSRLEDLRIAAGLTVTGLGMEPASDPQQLGAQLIAAVDGVREEARAACGEVDAARQDRLYLGVQRVFAVARSHYLDIDLEELSKGYPVDYTDAELDAIEEEVAPFAQVLSDKMQAGDEE